MIEHQSERYCNITIFCRLRTRNNINCSTRPEQQFMLQNFRKLVSITSNSINSLYLGKQQMTLNFNGTVSHMQNDKIGTAAIH